MNSRIAIISRRIAAILALLGTLFSVGGTLGLAQHYAHADTSARTAVASISVEKTA